MIYLIISIWNALSNDQRITVCACVFVILLAIGLYIYGQARKTLYNIPPLLYQMKCRCLKLANGIKVGPDFYTKALPLITNDYTDSFFTNFFSNSGIKEIEKPPDVDTFRSTLGNAMKSLTEIIKKEATADPFTIDRLGEYYCRASGLNDLLCTDKQYRNLNNKLWKILPTIPTEEITTAVIQYVKWTRSFGAMSIARSLDQDATELLPLRGIIDLATLSQNMETELAKSLSKVREAIGKYYKGN